jgi:hypothetical protein
MRALVVYESMFGNTRAIAEAIAAGLGEIGPVTVSAVGTVKTEDVEGATLLVVGGPTHTRGMSRPQSRSAAAMRTKGAGATLTLEPGATGTGLREWLESVPVSKPQAAVFDTRVDLPRLLTGRASSKIAAQLRRRGCRMIAAPESFLVVGKTSQLVPGEFERALEWGRRLARS